MTDFSVLVHQHMDDRKWSLRRTAAEAQFDAGLLSRVLKGKQDCSENLAEQLDLVLRADGKIIDAARAERARKALTPRRRGSAAVEALQVLVNGDPAEGAAAAGDGLAELVDHYALEVAGVPSARIHDDVIAARAFTANLLAQAPARQRGDLAVTAGWFSSLLAISATDLGDHAAAVVWCSDADRRGREAGLPELSGWSALTRSLIAWYQGNPASSAAHAQRGQALTTAGTAVHAKLAAQEMRSLAALGDAEGMTAARRRAAASLAALPPTSPTSGVFSIFPAPDPPYTATSLLVTGRHAEAAEMTRKLIADVYQPQDRPAGGQPASYARTLLILALAAAGAGDADEAAATGTDAMQCGPLPWRTLVLAGQLDQSLTRTAPGSVHAAGFRASYQETRLALSGAPE